MVVEQPVYSPSSTDPFFWLPTSDFARKKKKRERERKKKVMFSFSNLLFYI
jgi:hypothetical protein